MEVPAGVPISGLTAGLLAEDGRALGPAVVAPAPESAEVVVEVRGPCSLPQGTILRVVLDVVGESPITHDLLVARRRGLHAWLHADSRLPVVRDGKLAGLSLAERRRLGAEWCWIAPAAEREDCAPCGAPLSDDMSDLLSEMGVDVEQISPELREQLRER